MGLTRGNQHDAYGKRLLNGLLGNRYQATGVGTTVALARGSIQLDGIIDSKCAVEIEARNQNQVQVAIPHLLIHPAPLKLLVLIAVNLNNPEATAADLRYLLARLKSPDDAIAVVLLEGNGDNPKDVEDVNRLRDGLYGLGVRAES